MKLRISISSIIILLAGLHSCIEPIAPESLIFKELLVVEALVTNENKRHEVKLTRTNELDQDTTKSETGATVWVSRDDGTRYDFPEIKPGIYLSDTFKAESPFTYQLHIQTVSGKTYESPNVPVKKSPPVKDITARFIPDDGLGEGRFVFYVDTEESEETRYYRWEWTETYRVQVNHPSTMYWDGTTLVLRDNPSALRYCYAFDSSSAIIVAAAGDNGQVLNHILNEFHSTTQKLVLRYSIQARQYGLDELSFQYWNLIGTNNSQGGLFDEQPGTLPGNIRSTGSQESVLGLFEVTEVSTYRVFYSYEDFNNDGYIRTHEYIYPCDLASVIPIPSIPEVAEFIAETGDYYIPFYESYGFGAPPGFLFTKKICGDCREWGVLEQPEYWIE